jgi:tetratricopeptide (TPR) repeat protein
VKNFSWVVVAAAAVAVPMSAQAQSAAGRDAREVQRLLREGSAAFDAQDDNAALSLFQQAYRLSEEPTILVNIGRVFARMRRHEDAIATWRRFLDRAPSAPERPAIEAMIRDAESAQRAAQAATVVAPTRRDPPPPIVVPPPPPPQGPGVAPWIVLGAGVAAAASAAIPWFVMREGNLGSLRSDPRCEPRGDGLLCFDPNGELAGRYSSAQTGTILAGALLGVGVAGIAAGAIWAAVGSGSRERAPSTTVSFDPRGGVLIAGTFGGRR